MVPILLEKNIYITLKGNEAYQNNTCDRLWMM